MYKLVLPLYVAVMSPSRSNTRPSFSVRSRAKWWTRLWTRWIRWGFSATSVLSHASSHVIVSRRTWILSQTTFLHVIKQLTRASLSSRTMRCFHTYLIFTTLSIFFFVKDSVENHWHKSGCYWYFCNWNVDGRLPRPLWIWLNGILFVSCE